VPNVSRNPWDARYAVAVLSGSRLRYFARLLPVPVASYESRYLFGSMGHGISALVASPDVGALVVVAPLTLLAAVLLREVGRGLTAQIPRPRWSGRFVGLWLLCSVTLAACFSCVALWRGSAAAGPHVGLVQAAGGAGWPSILSALLVGFLVAVSLRSRRWILRAVADWLNPRLIALAGPSHSALGSTLAVRPRLASVGNGWSSRGPPLQAAVAVSIS
jgi:hypothetical protein